MSDPIGPGDWVECVDNTPHPEQSQITIVALRQLKVGQVYVLTGLASQGILLAGVKAAWEHVGLGWRTSRFRPIHRPSKSTLIEDLKTAIKEKARA